MGPNSTQPPPRTIPPTYRIPPFHSMSITPAWRTTLMSHPRRSFHLLRCATRPIQRDIQHTRSQSLHSSSSQLQDESNRPQRKTKKPETRYNFNTSLSFHEDTDPEVRECMPDSAYVSHISYPFFGFSSQHLKYRRVTAKDLSRRHEPPTRVKMLVRDFIDDSLYNVRNFPSPSFFFFIKSSTANAEHDPAALLRVNHFSSATIRLLF